MHPQAVALTETFCGWSRQLTHRRTPFALSQN